MNKKVIVPFIVVVLLGLLAAAIVFAPNLLETLLRMHGLR